MLCTNTSFVDLGLSVAVLCIDLGNAVKAIDRAVPRTSGLQESRQKGEKGTGEGHLCSFLRYFFRGQGEARQY